MDLGNQLGDVGDASANRDERHYADPGRFAIDRYPRGFADLDHMTFATGVHVCVGAHLARHMAWLMLEKLATRVSEINLVAEPERNSKTLVRSYTDLLIELVAA